MFFKKIILYVFIGLYLLSFKSFAGENSKVKVVSIDIETRAEVVNPTKILNDIEIKNSIINVKDKNIKKLTIEGKKVKKNTDQIYTYELKDLNKKFIRIGIEI